MTVDRNAAATDEATPRLTTRPETLESQNSQPTTSFAGNPGLDAGTLGRTSVGLVVVIALILGCAYLLRRFNGVAGTAGSHLKVIASKGLGQRERIVLVEIDDKWLVLGVTAQSINTLHTLDAKPIESDLQQGRSDTGFGHIFKRTIGSYTGRIDKGAF